MTPEQTRTHFFFFFISQPVKGEVNRSAFRDALKLRLERKQSNGRKSSKRRRFQAAREPLFDWGPLMEGGEGSSWRARSAPEPSGSPTSDRQLGGGPPASGGAPPPQLTGTLLLEASRSVERASPPERSAFPAGWSCCRSACTWLRWLFQPDWAFTCTCPTVTPPPLTRAHSLSLRWPP